VPQVGLEPTRLSALASKTSVATITPPGQKIYNNFLKNSAVVSSGCINYTHYLLFLSTTI